MKKWLPYAVTVVVEMLLACLLVFILYRLTYVKPNRQPQAPSATNVPVSSQAGDTERVEALTALIVMYSEQLEEYDRFSGSFVVACVGFAGVVLGLAINLAISKREEKKENRQNYGMAALFALIPGIAALCLYVFSMQCRRVVFFRGYLTYLEKELSQLIGIPMIFNDKVVPKFFGEFNTMNAGFLVMAIAVCIMLGVSIALCMYFILPNLTHLKLKTGNGPKAFLRENSRIIKDAVINIIFIVILTTFSYSCIVCVFDLCTNGSIPGIVYDFCINSLP